MNAHSQPAAAGGKPTNKPFKLTFVLIGDEETLTVKPDDILGDALAKALKKSTHVGQPVENWEVRDGPGTVFDLAASVGALGLKDGEIVYANLKAGAAG